MNAVSELISNRRKLVREVACLAAEGRLFQLSFFHKIKTNNSFFSHRFMIMCQRETTASLSSKYVVCATACVYRELYGKTTHRKKIA